MRRVSGGDGEGADAVRSVNLGSGRVRGGKRPGRALARNEQRSRHFRDSKIPKQKMPATRVAAPPAERMTSCISSRGVSQKSIVSHKGPEMYQPNQSRTRILSTRRFTPRFIAPVETVSQLPRESFSGFGIRA
jgi:hypothetical protein